MLLFIFKLCYNSYLIGSHFICAVIFTSHEVNKCSLVIFKIVAYCLVVICEGQQTTVEFNGLPRIKRINLNISSFSCTEY